MSSAPEENRPPYSMADLGASLSGLSVADRAGLVSALKGKLDSLAGRSSDYIDSLSPKVKRRVIALQEIQKQHDDFEAKFFEERAALEAKYQKLYEPLYSKRHDIVNGITDVETANEDVPAGASVQENHTEDEVKGVPEFWLNAMKSNEILAMQITERDEDALKYLTDIKSSNLENEKGFKIDFFFAENPFFKNTILTKTYHMIDEDEPILERATGTEIEWYPGKNLTKKVLKKKPKKGAKNNKLITKTEDCDSLFNFFSPPKIPDDDDDIDQETAEELQDLMEQDYDIGSTIRSKIIPRAVSWFTGEALQGDEFEDEEDGEGDDDDEEEDEDEDEEDDDDEEDGEDEYEAVKNKKGPLTKPQTVQRNTSSLPGGEQPPECKQQ